MRVKLEMGDEVEFEEGVFGTVTKIEIPTEPFQYMYEGKIHESFGYAHISVELTQIGGDSDN